MAKTLVQVNGMHKIFDVDSEGYPITSKFKDEFIAEYGSKVGQNSAIWIACDKDDTDIFDSMYSEGYTYMYVQGKLYNCSGRTKWFTLTSAGRLDVNSLDEDFVMA